MKRVLVIDNYDSFTYNLVHAVEKILGHEIEVWRNDHIDYGRIEEFDFIILSPGPGIPDEAGDLKEVIRRYSASKKMLGVCLGHQAIGEVFGANLRNLDKVYHGVQTNMYQVGNGILFEGVNKDFPGGRYHSWVIQKDTLNGDFEITAIDDQGEIMGISHKEYNVHGVQFHPESILTPDGSRILENFLRI